MLSSSASCRAAEVSSLGGHYDQRGFRLGAPAHEAARYLRLAAGLVDRSEAVAGGVPVRDEHLVRRRGDEHRGHLVRRSPHGLARAPAPTQGQGVVDAPDDPRVRVYTELAHEASTGASGALQ